MSVQTQHSRGELIKSISWSEGKWKEIRGREPEETRNPMGVHQNIHSKLKTKQVSVLFKILTKNTIRQEEKSQSEFSFF